MVRPMPNEELIQGSDEWLQSRLGKVTASRVADVVAKTKTGVSASRANYMAQLVAERLTGRVADTFTNAAMQHGIETEPQARTAYEFMTDTEVKQVGFIDHPRIDMAGASPDGLVESDGLVEIKCPNTSTHIDVLLSQKIPGKYIKQMQWQLACTERQWCDFVSFDNRLPGSMQIWISRIERDDKRIDELEREVEAFLEELENKVIQLRNQYDQKEAA